MVGVIYCIDTSSLLEGWERRYPPQVFPGFWGQLDTLIANSRLIAPREVAEEASKKGSDELKSWLKKHQSAFDELSEDEQDCMRDVLVKHTNLVKEIRRRTAADPYVIAMAKMRQLTVVTEEALTGNLAKPRIPDILQDPTFERPCITLIQLMKTEKWSFN